MPKMQNRVQETTTTGGTGTITLAGAVTGYITFAAGFTTGDVLFYTIDNGIGEWEIGIGTLVTTGTLSRTTVIASSNSGALVNFSSGTKRVFCSAPTRSLVPDQDSKSGYVLTTDGTNPSWTQTLNSVNIGNTTAGTGAFTTLSASSTVSGTGFSNYLASPPAIGGSSPAAGAFTTLSSSSTTTVGTNLVFSGTGNRITGDFSNATIANRVMFQSSASNTQTVLGVIPNGTSTSSALSLEGDSAAANGTTLQLVNNIGGAGTDSRIVAGIRGTGTYLPLTIYTGGSERVRISTAGVVTIGSAISLDPTTANSLVVNSSGNVGIGTSSPGARLSVQKNQDALTYFDISNETNGSSAGVIQRFITYLSSGTGTTSADIVKYKTGPWYFANNDGPIQMRAKTNGVELLSGAVVWTTLSDETEKSIIEPIESAVSKVDTLRSVIGRYNTDSPDVRRPFLIAQDVEKVLPEATPRMTDGKLGLDYSGTIPLLVAAIKELHAEIESLKQRIN